jgi:hypothetical protein
MTSNFTRNVGQRLRSFGAVLSICATVVGSSTGALAQAFVHPGLLNTSTDFSRMAYEVSIGAHPWIDSYNILAANSHTSLTYTPRPASIIYRGTSPNNYPQLYNDIAAVYQDTLMWQITGNTAYADKAVQICNAWSSTLTEVTGDSDKYLASGIYGYEFACAGENLRGYSGWNASDFAQFQNMMLTVFYPMNHDFLVNHNGTCIDHYYANWDLCNMASILAIGVLCDDRTKYNEALNYFYTGGGTGAIDHVVYQVFPDLTGQLQESGRDQGHSGLDISLLGAICQMAWSQGDDLFGYENNKFLSAAEYFAKYNLGNTVPYSNYQDCSGNVHGAISSGSLGDIRPTWALVYNHYANLEGLACPYTQQYVAKVGVEGGGGNYGTTSGGYDQLGFTTLTCGLPPISGLQAPTGVIATVTGPNVQLAWWGSANATSYNVARSTVSGGPYTTIASGVATNTYTDAGAVPGVTYYYVVQSVNSSTTSGYSMQISATPDTHITGTIIGTSGSYVGWNGSTQTGMTSVGAFDGNLDGANNFFDGPDASGDWVGIDVGAGYAYVPTQVKYCPRSGFESRMVGGVFQGSNTADFSSGVVTLYTITTKPADNTLTTATVNNTQAFRYLRYLGPTNGSCDVCELQFWGYPAANGTYQIVNRKSGLAMDVSGQGTANGTQIDQWPYAAQGNQQWTLTSLGNGQYQIMGIQSGRSLDVNGSSTADGAKVQIWDYLNGANQHFALIPTDSGYFRIAPAHSDKAIDVYGASTANGAKVDQWTSNGGTNQQWILGAP